MNNFSKYIPIISLQSKNNKLIKEKKRRRNVPRKVFWKCPICLNHHSSVIEDSYGCYEVKCNYNDVNVVLYDNKLDCGNCGISRECLTITDQRITEIPCYINAEGLLVVTYWLVGQHIIYQLNKQIIGNIKCPFYSLHLINQDSTSIFLCAKILKKQDYIGKVSKEF